MNRSNLSTSGAQPNPLLAREIRARFRDGRAFWLLFFIVTGLSVGFAGIYYSVIENSVSPKGTQVTGQAIFAQLAWMQTLGWLLVAPTLTSSSIAYERERGWFDSLLLSRMSPVSVVLGKWSAALLFSLVLMGVTLPLLSLNFLLGGVSVRQLTLVTTLHLACAMCGAAIGIAASAWSPRAKTATRTANGIVFIGLVTSFGGAAAANELPFSIGFPTTSANWFWTTLGRLNPVLRAVEITGDAPEQHTTFCLVTLAALTLIFLAIATFYARQPLPEAPFVESRSTRKNRLARQKMLAEVAAQSGAEPAEIARTIPHSATHGEIPFFSKIHFANPILDREVRSKFRMRQPPLAVIIVEIILGILVAGFYLRTLYWALFEPSYRDLIWWGMFTTGFIVTMMAAAVMGSNGLSREREGGTWEGVRLSLLSPGEILRGKIGASLLTCALFSLPVWPLLLPCINWETNFSNGNIISRNTLESCLLIWISTAWTYTLIGLWIGRKTAKTSRASGQTLGILTAFLLAVPFAASFTTRRDAELLGLIHPFLALSDSSYGLGSAVSYALFQLVFGLGIWWALHRALQREMRSAAETELRR